MAGLILHWSKLSDMRLVTMWNEGASSSMIGKELARTPQAILQRVVILRKKGVYMKSSSAASLDYLQDLIDLSEKYR